MKKIFFAATLAALIPAFSFQASAQTWAVPTDQSGGTATYFGTSGNTSNENVIINAGGRSNTISYL